MTYDEALSWWFSHANFEHRPASRGDLTLDRMKAILSRLNDPQRRLPIVHIAGSKGKGSTAAMLAAIFQQAGYRTGLFTSPHLISLHERFQVDGQPISRDELAVALSDIRAALHRHPVGQPTFFELGTAVGLLHFWRRGVEATVLEVGLGGRLDSTNVCSPVLSVITSISHDHTAILGDKLSSIAREKAGIIKSHRPVVSGATDPEARLVIDTIARQKQARLTELDRDFRYTFVAGRVTQEATIPARVQVRTRQRIWPELELNLHGDHQAANAAVVVACVEQLRRLGWHLPDAAVARGLREVRWPARMEVIRRRPLVVLDCAHNVASAQALARTLDSSFPKVRRFLVFAGSSDKDVAGMFRILGPLFARALLTKFTNNPRAVPPETLHSLWSGGTATTHETPAEALKAALKEAGPEDLICITGSLFLAGEIAALL